MAQFAPNIVFTNPTLASQLVRLSDLDAAQKNQQQAIALSTMAANANRAAREREANQHAAMQYAALMNQSQIHNSDIASRERMLQSQIGSQKDLLNTQLEAQKELARLNPWGKGGVDAFLGTAQINNNVDQANKDADAEAAQLNAQLNMINQEHQFKHDQYNPALIQRLGRGIGNVASLGLMDTNADKDRDFYQALDAEKNQKLTTLMGMAKKSYYDPNLKAFVAIKRSGIQMPGQPGQPIPTGVGGADASVQVPNQGGINAPAPVQNGLDFSIPGTGSSGTIPSRFAPVPWLDNPSSSNIGSTPPAIQAPSYSVDSIKNDFMNGAIDEPTAVSRLQALGL